jgi:hypothetical protein
MRKHRSIGIETDKINANGIFYKSCFIYSSLRPFEYRGPPIIQAPIAPYTSAQLVAAAVSNAGGLGSIGTALQSIDERSQLPWTEEF